MMTTIKSIIEDIEQYLQRYCRPRSPFSKIEDLVGIEETDYDEIEDALENQEDSFRDFLLRKIDESGMTDAECYKKAHLNRSHFNKIKNNPEYDVQKETVIALGLALELDEDGFEDLLNRAGYGLTRSKKFDIIIDFCIRKKIYDITEVNEILHAFQQDLLGANSKD